MALLWRCDVSGLQGMLFQIGKALGLLTLIGAVAGASVAFGTWRTAFRRRLLGAEPSEHETI
jgi:hypothetical protein